jgi:hypothetical protein
MARFLRCLRRLWKFGTCQHVNAQNWTMLLGETELHFCRSCGRLLVACDPSDQPQHNRHWLRRDQLDADTEQCEIEPWGEENKRLAAQKY